MKHRLVPDRGSRTQGEVATAYSTTRNAPDKTRYAGSTAFDGHRLQFRKNENERIAASVMLAMLPESRSMKASLMVRACVSVDPMAIAGTVATTAHTS